MPKVKKEAEVTNETQPVAVVPPTPAVVLWNKIKDLEIEIFSLPNQTVDKYFVVDQAMLMVDSTKLYGTLTASAALPILESTLAKYCTVEQSVKFLILTPVKD